MKLLVFLSVFVACASSQSIHRFFSRAMREVYYNLDATNPLTRSVCSNFQDLPISSTMQQQANFNRPSQQTIDRSKLALASEIALTITSNRLNIPREELSAFIETIATDSDAFLTDQCPTELRPEAMDCSQSMVIRTINGTCNNLMNPLFGAQGTPFGRLVQPEYEDGISDPRSMAVSGHPLPGAREISQCVSVPKDSPHPTITTFGVFFGQFLDHDLTLTPNARIMNSAGDFVPPQCCDIPEECRNPECFPIPIAQNDTFFHDFNQTCMQFARSIPALQESCALGHREQVNENTHFFDASNVYGSTTELANELREFSDGRMRVVQHSGGEEVLPSSGSEDDCLVEHPERPCFIGGDSRVNEQPVLASFHTLFVKYHNYLAGHLLNAAGSAGLEPTDEQVYQAARKMLIAVMQHIAYSEFLPVVVGETIINDSEYQLAPCQSFNDVPHCSGLNFTGYHADTPPVVANSFATASFRFAHTLIASDIFTQNEKRQVTHHEPIDEAINEPYLLYEPNGVNELLQGARLNNGQVYDSCIVPGLQNRLFSGDLPFGLDLLALNIQRGRDHGIPSYNHFRGLCGLSHPENFDDLLSEMSEDTVERLRCAYEHVNDIDLFVGGISEQPVNKGDGLVGPTFACLIAQQFSFLKRGDRFWFENPGQFTEEQLGNLNHQFLRQVICATTGLKRVQTYPIQEQVPNMNFEVVCDELDNIDASLFLDLLDMEENPNPDTTTTTQGPYRPPRYPYYNNMF